MECQSSHRPARAKLTKLSRADAIVVNLSAQWGAAIRSSTGTIRSSAEDTVEVASRVGQGTGTNIVEVTIVVKLNIFCDSFLLS